MDWYFWLIIAVASTVLLINLVLVIITYKKLKNVEGHIITSNLKMSIKISYDSENEQECMVLTIFNSNYREVVVRDFGIYYRNQEFNFIDEYMREEKMGNLPVIPARNSLRFKVDPLRLENFIIGHNYKSTQISPIYSFVVDSVGNSFYKKNKDLTDLFAQRQKDRIKLARYTLHNEKVEEFKKDHDNREPMFNSFWKMFHSSYAKTPKIVDLANSYQKEVSNINKEEKVEEKVVNINTTNEIKLTYLEPENSKKKRKTKATKVENIENN